MHSFLQNRVKIKLTKKVFSALHSTKKCSFTRVNCAFLGFASLENPLFIQLLAKIRVISILLCHLPLFIMGCTKYLEEVDKPQKQYQLDFVGNFKGDTYITTSVSTKVAYLLPVGTKAYMHVFYKTDNSLVNVLVNNKQYDVTTLSGVFVPTSSQPDIYLPNGSFKLYSVGVNSGSPGTLPVFSSGIAPNLANGVDYLSAEVAYINILPNSSTYSQSLMLRFSHAACQLEIKIVGGEGLTLNTPVTSIQIQEPYASNIRWVLGNPIPQATAVNTGSTILSANSLLPYPFNRIIIPINIDIPIRFTANVTLAGSAAEPYRLYTGVLPKPIGGFLGGNRYSYTITLNSNAIATTSVGVANWNTITNSVTYP